MCTGCEYMGGSGISSLVQSRDEWGVCGWSEMCICSAWGAV